MAKKPNPPFKVRLATADDVMAIHQVMVKAAGALCECALFFVDDEAFIRQHLAARGFILVALRKIEIVGFIMVRVPGADQDNLGRELGLAKADLSRVAHLESVAVLPIYQGKGLGRLLVTRAEERLAQDGFRYLMCTVAPGNLPSLHNFQALDYRIVATRPKYGGLQRHIMLKESR
jgi:ribosomal protein S18 acetylase RimI-like enzyme